MNLISANISIENLSQKYSKLIYNYYMVNKKHLENWEPKRNKEFYTYAFHNKRTLNRLEMMNKNKSMHFILKNILLNKIIGVCNYTEIDDNECWMGYSIAKDHQTKGIMYNALISSNKYMIDYKGIETFYAGIMNNNYKSIKLIKKLGFKNTNKYDELEINGKIEKLNIFKSSKIN